MALGRVPCKIAIRGRRSKIDRPVDVIFSLLRHFCFLVAVAHPLSRLRAECSSPKRFTFLAIGLRVDFSRQCSCGFEATTVGRCPITNLFEVFVSISPVVALVYTC